MIAVIDYGMGNLRSVQKAVQHAGGQDVRLVTTAAELTPADKIIFPGVAAFGDAMAQLRQQGLVDPIRQMVARGVPYLGFCLGLQLLFEVGYEDGEHEGLGILGGKVVRFDFGPELASQRLRVPNMGWNQIDFTSDNPMLKGIASGTYVYFAHSYYPVPSQDIAVTTTQYGIRFTSSVRKDNVFATQFHPEKSQAAGLRLLQNFVEL